MSRGPEAQTQTAAVTGAPRSGRRACGQLRANVAKLGGLGGAGGQHWQEAQRLSNAWYARWRATPTASQQIDTRHHSPFHWRAFHLQWRIHTWFPRQETWVEFLKQQRASQKGSEIIKENRTGKPLNSKAILRPSLDEQNMGLGLLPGELVQQSGLIFGPRSPNTAVRH